MDCPLLRGKYNKQCSAVKVTVVLSVSELESYCQNGTYRQCPVFKVWQQQKDQGLPLLDYFRATAVETPERYDVKGSIHKKRLQAIEEGPN